MMLNYKCYTCIISLGDRWSSFMSDWADAGYKLVMHDDRVHNFQDF